jgi:hypothetical protein
MIREYAIIRESAQRLAGAANHTVQSLIDEQVEQEPAFTDRMLGRIDEAMDGFVVKGVRWKSKTLTDRGPRAQESIYGADFMGVLEIELPEFSVKKGFLAQAKLIEPGDSISKKDFDKMVGQCTDMLHISPDSFLFLYSVDGISVVPAISIVSLTAPTNPNELYSRSITRFFEEHFESFIGDGRLSKAHISTVKELSALADASGARSALHLRATLAVEKQ